MTKKEKEQAPRVLINRGDIYDVVSEKPVSIGQSVLTQQVLIRRSEPAWPRITEIIEQRPDRGIYKVEAARRTWARVKLEWL